MKALVIKATKSTPGIDFNTVANTLLIEGESYPEDAAKFYNPILRWVRDFLDQACGVVVLESRIVYLNTSSSKCMMSLLDLLEDAHKRGGDICVNWYYDAENDMALECATEFKEDLCLPFNIVEDTG